MASEADIRGAERGRLVAVVAEHGTEAERDQVDLCVALERAEMPFDPEFLVRLARRVERRTRFGLSAVSCAADPPTRYCSCLERALEEPEARGKRAVLKRAAGLHWALPARRERPLEAVESTVPAAGAAPPSEPKPAPRPEPPVKPEPPFRVVRHFRRWYDEDEGPAGFASTKF